MYSKRPHVKEIADELNSEEWASLQQALRAQKQTD